MKADEAIKKIKEHHCCADQLAEHFICTDNCRYGKEECEYRLAIDALEKQVPKRPTYDGTFVWDEWLCPGCNSRYEVDYDNYNFCPVCGQAIDWEEGE